MLRVRHGNDKNQKNTLLPITFPACPDEEARKLKQLPTLFFPARASSAACLQEFFMPLFKTLSTSPLVAGGN